MKKVLVVEDNVVQINWAKKVLKDTNLKIAETQEEASNLLENNKFEYVLTDLEIPRVSGDKPEAHHGQRVFEKGLEMLIQKDIRGMALVSNFEHHLLFDSIKQKKLVSKEEKSEIYSANEKFKLIKLLAGVKVKGYTDPLSFEREESLLNFLVFLDSLLINQYPNFYKDGKVFTKEDVETTYKNGYHFCMAGGINLKPWKEIINALL
jgi:response regulator RpfG family c-di-GMP phosphodiesterase